MEEQNEYIRTFSEIEGLQPAYRLTYRIRPQNGEWRLEVEKRTKTAQRKEAILLCCPEQAAHHLVRFLYENAVPMESWQDIVADAVPNIM